MRRIAAIPALGCVVLASVVSYGADKPAANAEVKETRTSTTGKLSGFPVADTPRELTPLMERELRGCFDFFWNEWVSDPESPTYGMFCGDYIGYDEGHPLVIEEQGLYFMAIVAGVERGYITREQGNERILTALNSINKLKNINGFYYHFIDKDTGEKGWNKSIHVDLTNDGTSIMIIGALIAGEYFGGEIEKLANEIYVRANWKWFTNPETHFPYLTCYPDGAPNEEVENLMNDEGFILDWGFFGHHVYLFVIAAGAPNPEFRTGDKGYYTIEEEKGSYGDGEEFIFCRLGASFNYQWSQCYFDFRNMADKQGRNWFENAKHAAIAARQYAIDNPENFMGWGENSWGLSASIAPPEDCDPQKISYSGMYGSMPFNASFGTKNDGTIAPYASSAFVIYTPKESIEALEYMYTIPGLVGKYGLYDAYNFNKCSDGETPWIAKSYLGIDKGLVLPMFENYSSQLFWKLVHQNEHIQRGLKRLGFKYTGDTE